MFAASLCGAYSWALCMFYRWGILELAADGGVERASSGLGVYQAVAFGASNIVSGSHVLAQVASSDDNMCEIGDDDSGGKEGHSWLVYVSSFNWRA